MVIRVLGVDLDIIDRVLENATGNHRVPGRVDMLLNGRDGNGEEFLSGWPGGCR